MLKSLQHGALLMVAIVLVLIIVAMVTALSFLSVSNLGASSSNMQSAQAYFIAKSGLESALLQYKSGASCTAAGSQSNVAVGTGTFSTTLTPYPDPARPTNATLNGGITNSQTTIPVTIGGGGLFTNFAGHGSITIDSETIYYAGTSTQASVCGGVSTSCFIGAVRGTAGTAKAAHANGTAVAQPPQVLIRSTGTVGTCPNCAIRIIESSQPPASFAFLDGAIVTPVNTSATNIASCATALPAGTNLIIVSATFRNISAPAGNPVQNIPAGALQLKKGGVTLTSNPFILVAAGAPPASSTSFPQVSQYLLYRDAGAAANAQYDVLAAATVAGQFSAEVKMLVINGTPPNSSFQPSLGTVALAINCNAKSPLSTNCPSPTTLTTLASTLPAGKNVVLAAVQLDSTSGSRTVGFKTLVLNRTGAAAPQCGGISNVPVTCLAANLGSITFGHSNDSMRSKSFLLVAQDVGAGANPTYFVTGGDTDTTVGDPATINAQASILVLSGVQSAYTSNTSLITIQAPASFFGSASTGFASAGSLVVIAGQQYRGDNTNNLTISAGVEQIRINGTTVSSNAFQYDLGASCGSQCSNFTDALLYGAANVPANPTYDLWGAETTTATNTASTKIAVVQVPSSTLTVDTQEIFP